MIKKWKKLRKIKKKFKSVYDYIRFAFRLAIILNSKNWKNLQILCLCFQVAGIRLWITKRNFLLVVLLLFNSINFCVVFVNPSNYILLIFFIFRRFSHNFMLLKMLFQDVGQAHSLKFQESHQPGSGKRLFKILLKIWFNFYNF